MSATAPNSWQVMNAGNELAEVRARLISICPDIEDDQTLFGDMLEGEAPDAVAVIERLIDAKVAADALADAAKIRQDNLAIRKARFERQSEAYRAVALQLLQRINLRKLQRAQWTAGISNRAGKVVITDPGAVPTKPEPRHHRAEQIRDRG